MALTIPEHLIMKPRHLELKPLPDPLLLIPLPIPGSNPPHITRPLRVQLNGEGLVGWQGEEELDTGREEDVGVD